jgi:hypothetical protein
MKVTTELKLKIIKVKRENKTKKSIVREVKTWDGKQ